MPEQKLYKCLGCEQKFPIDKLYTYDMVKYSLCFECRDNRLDDEYKQRESVSKIDVRNIKPTLIFNEPDHYHKHEIDTIEFLQKGFPPSVFKGFAIGSAIKYYQRYEEKGGMDDLIKAVDFGNRLIDFHKKNPS